MTPNFKERKLKKERRRNREMRRAQRRLARMEAGLIKAKTEIAASNSTFQPLMKSRHLAANVKNKFATAGNKSSLILSTNSAIFSRKF